MANSAMAASVPSTPTITASAAPLPPGIFTTTLDPDREPLRVERHGDRYYVLIDYRVEDLNDLIYKVDTLEEDARNKRHTLPAGSQPPLWWPHAKPHMAFCDGAHDTDPHHADKICYGGSWEVHTALPYKDDDAPIWQIGLHQHVADPAPKIWLGVGESDHGRYITADEARRLAGVLLEAAERAGVTA